MNSSHERFIKYRKYWKSSRRTTRSRRQIPKASPQHKKDLSNIFGFAQIIIAIMSIVAPIIYSVFFSGSTEIANIEKIEEHNKAQDLKSIPAEVVDIGWQRYFSRYFINNESKEQVEAASRNYIQISGDEYNIGKPISYCDNEVSSPGADCNNESGALTYYSFSLKGKTKNPAVVTEISAVIDKTEDFYPEVLYFAYPQGSGENALFGFDLGSTDLEARETADYSGIPTDVHHLVKNHISLTEKDVVPITTSFLAPPGKRIEFHLEIFFENHANPLVIKDGSKPFSVVSYPYANEKPARTYVPVNVVDAEEKSVNITQCQWYSQCLQMVHGNIKKADISND